MEINIVVLLLNENQVLLLVLNVK